MNKIMRNTNSHASSQTLEESLLLILYFVNTNGDYIELA
jgi:hypothetical protein